MQSSGRPLRQALTRELGPLTIDVPVPEARGWTVAAWLVGHAEQFGVSQVTFAGQAWTPSSGRWVAYGGPVDMTVRLTERERRGVTMPFTSRAGCSGCGGTDWWGPTSP